MLSACASKPLVPFSRSLEPISLEPGNELDLRDGRARFRELFCSAMEHHGRSLPDYMPCEDALVRVGIEPQRTGRAVPIAPSGSGLRALMVPGLGYSCVKAWLDHDNSAPRHIARMGFEAELVEVAGIASSESNARLIAETIENMAPDVREQPLVLIGYSKGAPDILEFLVRYPDLALHIAAVVSYAGAIRGSPLAEDAADWQLKMLTHVPGAECETDDTTALQSLLPERRIRWLEENELPGHIRYYSIVSFPDPDRISRGLRFSYRKLSELHDARNDSQLIFRDQLIPGSTVLAFFNADHWAMSVPVARQHRFAEFLFVDENDFPREIAFEAVMRYIEEDLGASDHAPGLDPGQAD
jgi:hypothetical protein